jgi:hypothetical protein
VSSILEMVFPHSMSCISKGILNGSRVSSKIVAIQYEVSQLYKQGLVSYSRRGILKISTQLEDIVYLLFEAFLRQFEKYNSVTN